MGFDTFARRTFKIPLTAEVQRRAVDLVGDPGVDKGNPWVVRLGISPEDARLLDLWRSLRWDIEKNLEERLRKQGWYAVRDFWGRLMELRLGLGTIRCKIHFHETKEKSGLSDTMSYLLDARMDFTVSWSASLLQRLSRATPYVSIVSETVDEIRKEFRDMGLPLVEEHA